MAKTLLILEISIPEVPELSRPLLELRPKLLSFVFSFILLGIYWLDYHIMCSASSATPATPSSHLKLRRDWRHGAAQILISMSLFPI